MTVFTHCQLSTKKRSEMVSAHFLRASQASKITRRLQRGMVMSGITFDTIDARDKRLETRVSVAELAVIDGYAASFGFRTRGRYLRQVALNPETGGQAMQPVTAALAELATALYQISKALE